MSSACSSAPEDHNASNRRDATYLEPVEDNRGFSKGDVTCFGRLDAATTSGEYYSEGTNTNNDEYYS
jgi:hypothetical protein